MYTRVATIFIYPIIHISYMEEMTTISVRNLTRERLKALGSMGDSFDDVLTRLLDNHNKKGGR